MHFYDSLVSIFSAFLTFFILEAIIRQLRHLHNTKMKIHWD